MDLGALTAKRDNILKQQADNNVAKENNIAKSEQNTAAIDNNTSAQKTIDANISDVSSKIAGLESDKSGVGGEISNLKAQLDNPEIDDAKREQISGEVADLEASMEDIEKEMAKFAKEAEDLKAESEKNKTEAEGLNTEKGKLAEEKTDIDEKTAAFQTALKEVEDEIAIFNEIHQNADGTGDNITPETVDKAFADLEGTVLADGAKLEKEYKQGDCTVREYSDGTKIYHKPGENLTYARENLNDNYKAYGTVETKEILSVDQKRGSSRMEMDEYDHVGFDVTDMEIKIGEELRDTGIHRSSTYNRNEYYNASSDKNGAEYSHTVVEFSDNVSINTYDGISLVRSETNLHTDSENRKRPKGS